MGCLCHRGCCGCGDFAGISFQEVALGMCFKAQAGLRWSSYQVTHLNFQKRLNLYKITNEKPIICFPSFLFLKFSTNVPEEQKKVDSFSCEVMGHNIGQIVLPESSNLLKFPECLILKIYLSIFYPVL